MTKIGINNLIYFDIHFVREHFNCSTGWSCFPLCSFIAFIRFISFLSFLILFNVVGCERVEARRKIMPLIIIWASSFDHFLHSFLFVVFDGFSIAFSLHLYCQMVQCFDCQCNTSCYIVPSHMPAISIYNRNSLFFWFFIHTYYMHKRKCLSIQFISASFCIFYNQSNSLHCKLA